MNQRLQSCDKQVGFTLVECCVALATTAILLGQAVPAFHQLRQQQRLKAVSQAVGEDLRWARAEAITRGDSVILSFADKSAVQCYVIHTGNGGDCDCSSNGQTVCKNGATALRTHWMPTGSGISFRSNAQTLNFQPRQGLVSSTASIEIRQAQGSVIKQIIAITGRVRACAASGKVTGLKPCA